MESFLVSTGIVALAEIGDKTQLLSLLLAARFRRPLPIIVGILIATLANHALAAAVGTWVTDVIPAHVLHWILGLSFLAMAAWTMIPDKLDEAPESLAGIGILGTTIIAFFLAEMGDKTQFATVALAAQYHSLVPVVAGTTIGMMIANVPAVLIGDSAAHRLPLTLVRGIAASLFAVLGVIAITRYPAGV